MEFDVKGGQYPLVRAASTTPTMPAFVGEADEESSSSWDSTAAGLSIVQLLRRSVHEPLPADERQEADADQQKHLDGDRPGRPEDLTQHVAQMPVGQGGQAHIDRIAHEPAEEEGPREQRQGEVEETGGEEELRRWQRRHHEDSEQGQRADALSLDQGLRALQVVTKSTRQASLEMPRRPSQNVATSHRRERPQHHERNRVEVPVEPSEYEHGPRRRPERWKQVDPENDGSEGQVLHATTLRHPTVGRCIHG